MLIVIVVIYIVIIVSLSIKAITKAKDAFDLLVYAFTLLILLAVFLLSIAGTKAVNQYLSNSTDIETIILSNES